MKGHCNAYALIAVKAHIIRMVYNLTKKMVIFAIRGTLKDRENTLVLTFAEYLEGRGTLKHKVDTVKLFQLGNISEPDHFFVFIAPFNKEEQSREKN